MKLWLIYQNVNNGYDTYDSAVVAAESEELAKCTFPSECILKRTWNGSSWTYQSLDGSVRADNYRDWTAPDNVQVEFLADGYSGPAGVICSSFNAG